MIIMCTVCVPVRMKVPAPHAGFDVPWGQLSRHRRNWQRFLEGWQTSVAGGIRGSNTHCFARLPGRKGFYHLEHVRKSQHWLGQQTAGLSAAYGGRGL